MNNFAFLTEYINNPSPSGYELKGQQLWIKHIHQVMTPDDSFKVDAYQNAYVLFKSKKPDAPKVVIEAHADEISWVVVGIDGWGFIKVIENGGVVPTSAVTKRVSIFTKNGVVDGVFGFKPPHLMTAEDKKKAPTTSELYIDIGASSSKEVNQRGIRVGDPVVYKDELFILGNPNNHEGFRYLCGRGLDNKIGGYILAEVALRLKQMGAELPYDLYIVNAVQEEVGKRGASIMCSKINPDIAIVFDVTHDTSMPGVNGTTKGESNSGDGPVIITAPAIQKRFLKYMKSQAVKDKVKFQVKAKGSSTGTDADVWSQHGAITALVQIPLKYMHSTVEMVLINDVESTINLFVSTLLNIKSISKFEFTDLIKV